MTTNAERHRRTKTRITPEQHGDAPVWCDYTAEGQSCIVEAIFAVAEALEQNDEDTSPEAVHAECLFYALKPASLPWADQYDLATHLLERLADRLYDDAGGFEWTYAQAQRDTLAGHLAPALGYLASIVNVMVCDDDTAIDVSLDFVREVLGQEAKP